MLPFVLPLHLQAFKNFAMERDSNSLTHAIQDSSPSSEKDDNLWVK